MKERPILFSAPMVRAILEGRKTATRRVVKPTGAVDIVPFIGRDNQPTGEFGWCQHPCYIEKHIRCPYGQPGDRLWVKETFYAIGDVDGPAGSGQCWLHYRADESNNLGDADLQWRGPWTSPLFMRRRYSRITLEVTGVRVERLQDITPSQILAEGVQIPTTPEGQALIDISTKHGPARFLPKLSGASSDDLLRAHWAALWVQINGIESWHANPWVWVVEFKRVGQAHG